MWDWIRSRFMRQDAGAPTTNPPAVQSSTMPRGPSVPPQYAPAPDLRALGPSRGFIVAPDKPSCWQAAIPHVLKAEGGYVDHPKDPGGCTNMGITLATLREWRGQPDLSCLSVRELTEQEAREIYRARYWNAVRGDSLGVGISLVVFDFAVNAGVRRAGRMLQRAAGMSAGHQDGVIGPATLSAVYAETASTGKPGMVRRYSALRREYYRSLPRFDTFGKGWLARTDHMEGLALQQLHEDRLLF